MARMKAKRLYIPGSCKDKRTSATSRPRKVYVIKKRIRWLLCTGEDGRGYTDHQGQDHFPRTCLQAFEILKMTIFDRLNSKKTKSQLRWSAELTENKKIDVQRLKVTGL
jgi:hypothetical protein